MSGYIATTSARLWHCLCLSVDNLVQSSGNTNWECDTQHNSRGVEVNIDTSQRSGLMQGIKTHTNTSLNVYKECSKPVSNMEHCSSAVEVDIMSPPIYCNRELYTKSGGNGISSRFAKIYGRLYKWNTCEYVDGKKRGCQDE